jgi:hypothetical protein
MTAGRHPIGENLFLYSLKFHCFVPIAHPFLAPPFGIVAAWFHSAPLTLAADLFSGTADAP